tara:strand:+ start:32 stop:361 length:330 start_codon:yes stop_codon:yes gene_type:complete
MKYADAEQTSIAVPLENGRFTYVPVAPGNSDYDAIVDAGTEIGDYVAPAVTMAQVRADRDALLASCDWVVTKAIEAGAAVPSAWVTYRTSLRDFPAAVDLDNIVWPDAP